MAACRPGPGSAPPDGLSEPGDAPPTALVSRGAMVRGAWWARARARGVAPSLHFGRSACPTANLPFANPVSAGVDRCSPSLSQSGGEMTHLWSPWRGSCTRQGGQHTVEARSQADPLSHCAALCRPCCTTAAACPHHRRHCPHAGADYLDARQRAKLTRSVVNSAKKTCVYSTAVLCCAVL